MAALKKLPFVMRAKHAHLLKRVRDLVASNQPVSRSSMTSVGGRGGDVHLRNPSVIHSDGLSSVDGHPVTNRTDVPGYLWN